MFLEMFLKMFDIELMRLDNIIMHPQLVATPQGCGYCGHTIFPKIFLKYFSKYFSQYFPKYFSILTFDNIMHATQLLAPS